MMERSILTAKNLEKSYKGRKVVNNISLEVRRGEIIGLLGPNGAGKTTSFYMIVGLVKADGGDIFLNDKNLTSLPMYQRAGLGISYLPQENSIFRGMTVEENIFCVLEIFEKDKKERKKKLENLLEEFSIGHIRKSNAMALSGGERRRVEIARALASEPEFILLDEPFAGIDPIAVNDIIKIIKYLKEKNLGILITDHNVRETLSIVDKSYIVYNGEILTSGTPEEIIKNQDVKKVYLGDNFNFNN